MQTKFDSLRASIQQNEEKALELEAQLKVQFVRIAQIQQEIERLKSSRE